MRHLLRCFGALLKTEIGVMLQYRGEIVLWSVWGLINPLVLYLVFKAGALANPSQTMAGMTVGELGAYFFAIMIIGHITAAWDTHEMGWYVRTGRMSPLLLRPILPMWRSLASNMAYKICTLAFVGPMWAIYAVVIRPAFHPSLWQVGAGIVATALAIILAYLLSYVVALIAFWATKLDAVGEIYFGLVMLLGGRFAPLEAMPPMVRRILEILPFQYMAYFPAELFMGRVAAPETALFGLMTQVAWILASVVGFRIVWAAAVKRYTAVSG
jgi:ABC-2 type transport system permease protein